MPLARILTRFPEQAGALSNELRQHGYTVEFANPELTGKPPADLEIDFEICAEPEALSRASELADSLHTDVAVSPGVLITPGQVADEPVENPAEQVTAGSFAHNDEVEIQGPPLATLEEIAPVQNQPAEADAMEAAHMAAMSDEPRAEENTAALEEFPRNRTSEASQVILPANMLAEPEEVHARSFMEPAATAFDDEVEIARAASPSQPAPEKESDFLAHAGDKSAAALQSAAVAGKDLWAAARERSQDAWASVRQRSLEYREQLRVRRAEMEAERQYKLLQLEKRRELAEQRAAELESARQAAAARLQQLLRERGALTEAQPAPPQKVEPTTASVAPASERPQWRRVFERRITFPFARAYRPQMEAVLMGVAAACSLFVLGLAVASFHARPAISNSFRQPQPSNGVTVQGGGVTLKAGTPAAPASQAVAPGRMQATQKPAAIRQRSNESDVTVRRFPTAAKPSPGQGSNSKHLADDVVIRHFGTQPQPPAQAAVPQAGLKHYSDLDN